MVCPEGRLANWQFAAKYRPVKDSYQRVHPTRGHEPKPTNLTDPQALSPLENGEEWHVRRCFGESAPVTPPHFTSLCVDTDGAGECQEKECSKEYPACYVGLDHHVTDGKYGHTPKKGVPRDPYCAVDGAGLSNGFAHARNCRVASRDTNHNEKDRHELNEKLWRAKPAAADKQIEIARACAGFCPTKPQPSEAQQRGQRERAAIPGLTDPSNNNVANPGT